jgi:hypothetical protein
MNNPSKLQEALDFFKNGPYSFSEMNLDGLCYLDFQNRIIKRLNVESIEYCYLIPIVSRLAEYLGDIRMAYFCKIMSKQVKQNITNMHGLLSPSFSYLEPSFDNENICLNSVWSKKEDSKILNYLYSQKLLPNRVFKRMLNFRE